MTQDDGGLLRLIRLRSAMALVVANIIGVGIFTSTGFQAGDLGHPGVIFLLWIVGGVLAFCGALCYGELGAAIPRAGGEYVYLRRTYGGVFGFMSAFVSLIAGFSAPIAVASKGFVRYAAHFFPALADESPLLGAITLGDLVAIALVWLLIAIHLRGVRRGIVFNDLVTLFKVCGIVMIILAAAAIGKGSLANLTHVSDTFVQMTPGDRIGKFASALIYVMFGYSGWNAAAYIAGEMKDPQRDLPRALLFGTGIVVVLYLALNAVYFYGAPVEELAYKAEVGLVSAEGLFGSRGVSMVSMVICLSIFASASAMTIAGPRVYYALGRDYPLFGLLARTGSSTGAPVAALFVQGAVTTLIVVSGRIDQIMAFAGFTLTLFASLAVSCVIVLRFTEPQLERPFRAWGYPATPVLFLAVSGWMMIWALRDKPWESGLGLVTVAIGGIIFYLATLGSKTNAAGEG
ncbi:amino acid permease [Candidatus Sumerlaeota bacterium]|nr:amino acid permease [Candidatus Sumerlaeota bacterium]